VNRCDREQRETRQADDGSDALGEVERRRVSLQEFDDESGKDDDDEEVNEDLRDGHAEILAGDHLDLSRRVPARKGWWRRVDSNHLPADYETAALAG
jgi:hypothetical protein